MMRRSSDASSGLVFEKDMFDGHKDLFQNPLKCLAEPLDKYVDEKSTLTPILAPIIHPSFIHQFVP